MDRPVACVSATTSGCCQSVWKPGWTSVSSARALSGPPGCQKPDALVVDLEGAADPAEGVEERHHRALLGAAHVDVAAGGQRRAGPGRGLQPVRERAVVVAVELVDAGDADRPVGVHRDDGAHLLQHAIRSSISGSAAAFDSSVTPSASTAVSSTCSVAPTDGYGSRILRAAQPLRGLQVLAVGALLDRRAELAQHVEVEVDRPAADVAAAEARDEGVAEPVQQRAAEQDRDAAGARVGVDVGDVGALHLGRVEDQLARLLAGAHGHAVQLQQAADDPHVADLRHVAQPARARCRAARRPSPWAPGSSRRGRGSRPRAGCRRGQAVHREAGAGHGSRVPEWSGRWGWGRTRLVSGASAPPVGRWPGTSDVSELGMTRCRAARARRVAAAPGRPVRAALRRAAPAELRPRTPRLDGPRGGEGAGSCLP